MRTNPLAILFILSIGLAGALLCGSSCCPPPPAECTNASTPTLVVQVAHSFTDLPLKVTGWACGGAAIDDQRLAQEYEIIVYVHTDKWYIQPFASDFRHPLRPGGCFDISAHDGDPVHVFLARRGWTGWEAATSTLREVDGTNVIAEWDSTGPPPRQCSDGVDNDSDGLVDGDDPGCVDDDDNDESDEPPPACSDGVDNDLDGTIDTDDCACADASGQSELYDSSQDLAFLSSLGDSSTKWVDYSPTQYDPGSGLYPSELQIGLDLYVLKESGFDGVLTYSAADTLASIPRLAREQGFGVVGMGIWDPLDQAEVDRAIAERDHVTFYIVGSEGLFVTPPRYTKAELRSAISRVRNEACRPVTTAEPWDVMLANTDLFDDLDFISVNIYPWWTGLREPQAAVESLQATYAEVVAEAGGATVVVRETGFPTAGHPTASAAYQQCYFSLLSRTGVPFVYFEAFDQYTKHEVLDGYDIGPHWGLFDKDRNEKEVYPDSEALSCSQASCPGCQGTLYTMPDVCYEEQYSASRIGLDCYKVGISDRDYPVSECDFEYYEGHAGGSGETLEIVGCNDAVYMQWAYGRLQTISVREGWQGETDRGLGIGDSLAVFQELYPEARPRTHGLCEPSVTTIWTAGHLKVNVDEQDVIDMMAVDFDDHSTEDDDQAVSWFAPRNWP